MSLSQKYFSQVKTLSASICLWKSLSTTRYFVSSLSQSSRHLRYSSFHGAGSFHIPIPLVLQQVQEPTTEQLSPGMFKSKFFFSQIYYNQEVFSVNILFINQTWTTPFWFLCTVLVMWQGKKLNNKFYEAEIIKISGECFQKKLEEREGVSDVSMIVLSFIFSWHMIILAKLLWPGQECPVEFLKQL